MEVQTGARKVGEVEIVKGIGAGDLVITEGMQRIGPGTAVQPMVQNPSEKPAAGAGVPGK